jgi:hypothetical protein
MGGTLDVRGVGPCTWVLSKERHQFLLEVKSSRTTARRGFGDLAQFGEQLEAAILFLQAVHAHE